MILDQETKKKLNVHSYPALYIASDMKLRVDISFEDDNGHISSGSPLKVVAGTQGTWTVRVTNEERDFPQGTIIQLVGLNYQFAYRLQSEHPGKRDYVTLDAVSEAKFAYAAIGGSTRHLCTVIVQEGTFHIGESLTMRLGDRRFGSAGSEVFWTAGEGALILACDPGGMGTFYGVEGNPYHFEVIAHDQPCLVRLLGPTVVTPGQRFRMNLGVFDRNGNVIEDFVGRVRVNVANHAGIAGLPEQIDFAPEHKGNRILPDVWIDQPGVYRIEVSHEQAGSWLSNPIVVEQDPETFIYWGDIHCHGWGDSTMYLMHLRTDKMDPLSRHLQARDIGRLDFAAPGPMSFPRTDRDEIWSAYRDAVRQLDEPGAYVPYLSYEAHPPGTIGDRNVIFKQTNEPLPPDYAIPMEQLEQMYGGRDDVFLQVHIGGGVPRWDNYRTRRERMVEISSGFGNAEWLLRKALQLGYRPAVCGCSDLHMGLLGGPRSVETFRGRLLRVMQQRDSAYGTGPLTAVCAGELSRDHLWNAMESRRTYATSGARIYLRFACDGHPSGSVVRSKEKVACQLKCHGTARIDKIDLICGNYAIKTWQPDELDFEMSFELNTSEIPGDWLYIRVYQADENYAWTTPIWIERDYPAWNEDHFDLSQFGDNEATPYLADLIRYLQTEENIDLFHEITPVGIIRQTHASCALFYCYYGAGNKMAIRWYYEYEIPKIRFDWGWQDFGIKDDEVAEYLY